MSTIDTNARRTIALIMVAPIICQSAGFLSAEDRAERVVRDYAPVNGLRLYYEIHGHGSAAEPPLVLLHGGGSTLDTTFGRILPTLSTARRVIAFDQQGHGRTADIADRPFSFEQSADDAVGLLGHLQIERADWFGFSNGGNIALQTAIRHPTRVRKLIVASAMYKRDGLYPQVWDFIKRSTPQAMPQALQDAYRKTSPHPEQLQTFHDKSARRMLEFKDWPADDIRSIRAPTLVIIGDADSVRPEHAVEMFRLLPHAKLAVLPGGHGSYIGEASAATLENSQVRFGDQNSPTKSESKIPGLAAAMIEEFLAAPMTETRQSRAPRSQ
jgi:pimeloyl-ACP methyl ester carboxylesterase